MKCALALLVVLCATAFASIPASQSNRFTETGTLNLAPNSVTGRTMADFAIGSAQLQNGAVAANAVSNLDVSRTDILAPDVITTDSFAFDLVRLTILPFGTVPAQSQDPNVFIQTGPQAIWPWENVLRPALGDSAVVDAPNVATSYRVENKARGPGTIIGWYPNRNGHLLRYQASRALQALTCTDLILQTWVDPDVFDDDGSFDDNTHNHAFFNTRSGSTGQVGCPGFCVDLDCSGLVDFNCALTVNPQTCGYTTSVEDVNNPQEGVPVYAPSVERITINAEGLVEMWYFGSGSIQPGADVTIEITVVVLLDESYGAK